MKTAVVAVTLTLTLTLSSCALLPPAPPEPSSSASASDTPTPTPSAEPTLPAARDASTPFDEWDAYLACRQLTPPYFFSEGGGNFFAVEYQSFADSFIFLRTDGLYFIYSEVENGNGDPALASVAAANCIVGGTLASPRYELFGATIRLTDTEVAATADAALPTG